jgi:hypothetical protein
MPQTKSMEPKSKTAPKQPRTKTVKVKNEFPEPLMASLGEFDVSYASCAPRSGGSSMRRNGASTNTRTDRYANLEKGVIPYVYGAGGGKYDANISLRDAIVLCQKAYYNVPIFRNTIDLMTEFSLSKIKLTKGNVQSKKFFELWLKKINNWDLQDQFYREFYRSGNIFLYALEADMSRDTMMKIEEAFGAVASLDADKNIPIKYLLLNPADIEVLASSSFSDSSFVKILNDYELEALSNPKTDQDQQIVDKIPELKKIIQEKKAKRSSISARLTLDKDKLLTVFYKKQDYEPLAVPMGFPVLEDVNWKLELKKIDMAIARTVQQAVLLITMGSEESGPPSEKVMASMRALFDSQSVGKVLIADFTTKAEFLIPEIGNILDPKKYEIVDKDIKLGLNNILFGEEKYANTSIKVKVFLARLNYGREVFLNKVLIPEMKKVAKRLGFKSIPEPVFHDIDFEDNVLMSRVYSRLTELGVLTPEEGMQVFETGLFPTHEESLENQRKFKELRDEGLYSPLVGGANKNEKGRPAGTGSPQAGRKTGAIGEVKASAQKDQKSYSMAAMKEVMAKLSLAEKSFEQKLRAKFKIKKLNKDQKAVAGELVEVLARNYSVAEWENAIEKVIAAPVDSNDEMIARIDELACEHGVDSFSASLLYHSELQENSNLE